MKEENLKILIATGIFPPDVGGPAKYAKNLQEQFLNRRFFVKVLAYGIEKKLPFFARHIFYFLKIIFNLNKVDLIIALDLISTGFPSVLAARIFKKKIILRTGGDFLWETYVERTGNLISLSDFYKNIPPLPLKHKIILILQRFVLSDSSAVVFNSFWQRDFFKRIYRLDSEKLFVVENFYPVKFAEDGAEQFHRVNGGKFASPEPKEKIFIFAGRKLKLKNLTLLEKIFGELKETRGDVKLEIVDNFSQTGLEEKIKNSYALILPSITDLAPNFIIEGLRANKPFILTKNCGLFEKLKDVGIFVDPFDKDDIKNKILFLSDEDNYKEYKNKIESFNFVHTWEEIADEFLAIYRML